MKVIIMQGISGSGKTSHAATLRKLWPWGKENVHVAVFSADFFHTDENGNYRFNKENAVAAHHKCFDDYDKATFVTIGKPDTLFIVDNTNCTAWEIAPYYRLAEVRGHDVSIVRVLCPVEIAIGRNVHDVPASTIWEQYKNLMKCELPSWWKIETVTSAGVQP